MDFVEVSTWIDILTRNHKFRARGASYGNSNLTRKMQSVVKVKMAGGTIFTIPEGVEVTIFRRYTRHGNDVVATIFLEDRQIVIRGGGVASEQLHRERQPI